MKTSSHTTIAEHWDTAAIITSKSDPVREFQLWREHAAQSPDWTGDEFSYEDFRAYIESLPSETTEAKFRRLINAATARYDAATNLEEQQAAKRELQALVNQQHAIVEKTRLQFSPVRHEQSPIGWDRIEVGGL